MKAKGLLTIILATMLYAPLWGDTLTLKDGTSYKGEFVLETETEYLFNVQVKEGLKDERTFKKEDVQELVRSTPADLKFEEISSYTPTPDRLTLADYDLKIKEVQAFLTAFKTSKYTSKARTILTELEKERGLVKAGGIKFNNKWLTKEEFDSDAYEIDAQMVSNDIKELAEKGSQLAALRKYQELKTEYPGTKAFQQALPVIKGVLDGYENAVKTDLSSLKSRIETREKGFATLPASQRKEAMEAVKRQQELFEKRLAFEKKKKVKWLTLDSYHERSMRDALKAIETERKFVDKVDLSKLPDASGLYRTAWEAASANNRTRVEELANELKSAGVKAKHFKLLQARLEEKAAEAEAAGESAAPPETPVTEEVEEKEETPSEEESSEESEETEDSENDQGTADTASEEESGSMVRSILIGVIALVVVIALAVVLTGGKKGED